MTLLLPAAVGLYAACNVLWAAEPAYNAEAVREMIIGYQLLRSKEKEQAAEHLLQAVKLDRKSRVLKTLYAEALFELHRFDEVIKLLEPLAGEKDSVETQMLKLLAFSCQATWQMEKAVDYYKRIIKQEPQDDWIRRRLLELLKAQGRFQEIIPLYKPLLDPRSDTYARDLFQMGALYLKIGGREPARQYLEKAIAADSSLADAYRLLGSINELERKWQEALENYLAFLELRPEDADQVFTRILAVALKTVYPASQAEGSEEKEAAGDSSAWHNFLVKIEKKQQAGDSLNPALKRVSAIGYEAIGRKDKALEIYRELAEKDPGDGLSRRSLLRLLYEAGRYQEMIPIYEQILDPSNETYSRDLMQLGALYLKTKDRKRAKTYIKKALAADSSLADAYRLLGHISELEENWHEAVECYLAFIKHKPEELKNIFDRLLAVSIQAGEEKKAIALVEKLISQGHTSAWITEQLARLYYHSGEYEKALNLLEPLKKDNRLSDNGYFVLGFVYSRLDRLPESVEAFIRVKKSRPDFIPVYLTLGRLYFTMKELDKALQVLEEGLRKADPDDRENKRLKKVTADNPNFAPALNYLGYFYAERGIKLQEARRLIELALEQEPDNGHYIDSMGWVLFKMGRLKAALNYIKSSLAKLGGHPEVYEHLGDIYYAMGEHELARQAWTKSLEMESGNAEVKKKLEQLLSGQSKKGSQKQ